MGFLCVLILSHEHTTNRVNLFLLPPVIGANGGLVLVLPSGS
jgi:hypothetical protein